MIKKYFLSGLAILFPIGIALLVFEFIFDFLTNPFIGLSRGFIGAIERAFLLAPEAHPFLTACISRLLALLVLITVSTVLGMVMHRVVTRFFILKFELLLSKIPVVKTIFKMSKDLSGQFLSQDTQMFKEVVLAPFPNSTTSAIGFVTTKVTGKLKEACPELDLCVFIPTAPHPMSGFILLTPNAGIKKVDITTEEAFRFILSCGTTSLETKE